MRFHFRVVASLSDWTNRVAALNPLQQYATLYTIKTE